VVGFGCVGVGVDVVCCMWWGVVWGVEHVVMCMCMCMCDGVVYHREENDRFFEKTSYARCYTTRHVTPRHSTSRYFNTNITIKELAREAHTPKKVNYIFFENLFRNFVGRM